MPPSSRRRPFPYDARFRTSPDPQAPSTGNIGVMFVPQQAGLLVGKKQNIVEYPIPNSYAYDSAPLYKERTFIFRPTGGMGQRIQSSVGDTRYYYGLNVWVFGGLVGKGPLFHDLAPGTTGEIRQFIDALGPSSVLTQYILAGTHVLRRSDDSNGGQVADDTRAGATAQSAVRFRAQGTSPVDALYVAWSDGVLRQRSASAWATCTLPAGFNANWLATDGPELIAADSANSCIRVCTNDPTIAGSWGGPIFMGNPSVPITGMTAAAGRLIVFKADGSIYTVNADGSTNDETPGARVAIDLTNGRTCQPWLNSVYVRLGPTFWEVDMPAVTLTPIGPERQLDNASPVYGPVQAFVGWGAQTSFAVIYNAGQNTSYLLTYGNFIPDPQTDSFKFVSQYDGALGYWSKRATALGISNVSGNDRLYVGFADGSFSWFKLVANPLAIQGGAEFTSAESDLVLPWHTALFEADLKAWLGFSIFGPAISQTDYVNFEYRLSGNAGGPPISDNSLLNAWNPLTGNLNYSGFRLDTPPNLNGSMLSLLVKLTNFDTTRTPVLEGVGIHERVIPRFRLDYSGTIDASDWVARRDGAAMRQSGRSIRAMVQAFTASPNLAVIELPDETLDSLAIFEYTEHMQPWKAGGDVQWQIDFSASQFATLSVYGIIRRLSGTRISDLSGYTITQLEVM
jgi:hypothetical protein